jgi:AcrR family transcriptional regulator
MNDTKARLLRATHEVLQEEGIAGISARVVATRADVNQALVFYHFGSVVDLVVAACRLAVDESVAGYRDAFAGATSFGELLTIGRNLHERERASGNVAVMAQLMAGAQQDPALAEAGRYAMATWNHEIEAVVRRVLVDSPLLEIADPAGLARAISAGFLGLELYEGVDPAGADHALAALEQLGVLVEVLDDLGAVGRRAVRARIRRSQRGS